MAVGQAYVAKLNFERGNSAGSPWFHVVFAGAYAFLALVNFWQYRKLAVAVRTASAAKDRE